jgi:hypothetical protein
MQEEWENDVGEEGEEEGDGMWGPRVSESRVEMLRVFLSIRKYQCLQMGPRASNTYKMVDIKKRRNCNDIFPNTRIVMAYL